jgi:thioredoxin-related protein
MDSARWIQKGKEVLSEIVVVGVAACFVILLLRAIERYQSPKVSSAPKLPSLSVGAQLKVASVDLSQSPLTVVLVSSPTCMYCLASKPFHAKLVAETERNHVPFYVAIPSRKDSQEYLQDAGFTSTSVREWKDLNLRADATPTIVVADNSGAIKAMWVGVLAPFDESELLKAIGSHSPPPATTSSSGILKGSTNYSMQDLEKLGVKQKISIVDTHERGYPGTRPDAIIMPLLELRFRAPVELDRKKLQIVDCSNLAEWQCETSVEHLNRVGFRVATLNAGLYRLSCSATNVH